MPLTGRGLKATKTAEVSIEGRRFSDVRVEAVPMTRERGLIGLESGVFRIEHETGRVIDAEVTLRLEASWRPAAPQEFLHEEAFRTVPIISVQYHAIEAY